MRGHLGISSAVPLLVALSDCSPPPAPREAESHGIASAKNAAPPPTAAAPSLSSSTSAADAAAPATRRPRVSSSPNAIECHDVACELATQICCTDGHTFGRCVPRADPGGCAPIDLLRKECDELGDCDPGHVCCYAPRPDPSVQAMKVCRENDCEDPDYETCLAGGSCSRGRRCKLADEHAYDGYCH